LQAPKPSDADLLSLAKRRLDTFDAIWVDSQPNESTAALVKVFGADLARSLSQLTPHTSTKNSGLTSLRGNLLERITASNQLDIELYEYARSKLTPVVLLSTSKA
jgi:hypothetical protein